MNVLRPPQEKVITTFAAFLVNNTVHWSLKRYMVLLAPVLLMSGIYTSNAKSGPECSTFPKVGERWFYSSEQFLEDLSWWQNLTDNKLVSQVNHRTLGMAVALLFTYSCFKLLRL